MKKHVTITIDENPNGTIRVVCTPSVVEIKKMSDRGERSPVYGAALYALLLLRAAEQRVEQVKGTPIWTPPGTRKPS